MKYHEDKRKMEFQVGLFTIVAIIILALAYIWFSEILLDKKYSTLKIAFSNVGNIEIGSDVCLNGVKKGRVKSIRVQPDCVLVELKMILDYPLRTGTSFKIIESNLMGDARVEISPGAGEKELDLMEIQAGDRKLGLAGLIAEMGDVISNLESVLSGISGQEKLFTDLQLVLVTTQEVLNNINSNINKNAGNFERLLDNSNELTDKISRIVDDNEEGIADTIEKSGQTLDELSSLLNEMKKLTGNMQVISEKMLGDDSSFSRLISEQDLYDNLVKATANLDSLLQDIKKNPKKYFEVKVF